MVSFSDDDGVLEIRHRHEVIRVEAWGADSVRVRAAQYRIPARKSRRARRRTPRRPRHSVSDRPKIEISRTARPTPPATCAVDVSFDGPQRLPGTAAVLPQARRHRTSFREQAALLDARRPRLRRQPLRRLRDPPAVRRLRRRAPVRARPAHPRPAEPEGPGARPGAAQRRGDASRSCCRAAATACCGTARPSAGSSSRTTPPAGWPARRGRSTTGSPPARLPPTILDRVRRRHRPRPRAARLGQRVLAVQAALPHPGRAARRSRASTPAAACRCR